MSKHILFDFDGTIVDSLGLAINIYNEMNEQYKLKEIKKEDITHLKGLSIKERIKLFNVPLYLLPKMGLDFKKRYEKNVGLLKLIAGMEEVILELKRLGYPLSIVSSNSVSNIKQFLMRTNVDVFEQVYASKALFGKQNVLNQVARKLNITKDQMIYIGDELRDIVSCRKAGVEIIAVTWGFDAASLIRSGNPDYVAEQPSDIIDIISQTQK